MTRTLSAAAIKAARSDKRFNANTAPTEGTKLADVYHELRRGGRVQRAGRVDLRYLQDAYGMVIRSKPGRGGYIELVGEWDGDTFLTPEQTAAQEQSRDVETAKGEQP